MAGRMRSLSSGSCASEEGFLSAPSRDSGKGTVAAQWVISGSQLSRDPVARAAAQKAPGDSESELSGCGRDECHRPAHLAAAAWKRRSIADSFVVSTIYLNRNRFDQEPTESIKNSAREIAEREGRQNSATPCAFAMSHAKLRTQYRSDPRAQTPVSPRGS